MRAILRRLQHNPLPVLLVFALVISLPGLGRSLWLDEGASLALAEKLTRWDAQRPLYFCLLRVWLSGGNSELWIRLPSLFFGLGNLALTYSLARRCFNARVALVAALLMLCSAPQILHSQEARMYTMAPFLLLAAIAFLLSWIERRRLSLLAAFTLLAILSVLTFPFCALGVVAALGLALGSAKSDRRAQLWLCASGASVALIWLPFLRGGLASEQPISWIEPTPLLAPVALHGWALLATGPFHSGLSWTAAHACFVVAGSIAFALALLGALSSPNGRRLALAFYSCLLLPFLVSIALQPIWVPRYLMPFLPAMFVLLALGLERVRAFSPKASAAILGLLVAAELAVRTAGIVADPGEQWRQAAAYLKANAGGETVAIYGEAWADGMGVWRYYYSGPTTFLRSLPAAPGKGWLLVRTRDASSQNGVLPAFEARMKAAGAQTVELPGMEIFKL